jgi:hypothetical protein
VSRVALEHAPAPPARDAPAGGRGTAPGDVLVVALPFVWLGMVLAISFVATPLKFQAPGVTLPLGLQIGRLVFPALNLLELLSAAVLTGLLLRPRRRAESGRRLWLLLAGIGSVLAAQALVLRPVLDARAVVLIEGGAVPDAPWHLLYVSLELLKVGGLVALGALCVALAVRLAATPTGNGRGGRA